MAEAVTGKAADGGSMDRDLSAACQMFLIPTSILFAALGVAGTEQLKTLLSVMGVFASVVWLVRVCAWKLGGVDKWTVRPLAAAFLVAWVIALVAHAYLWIQIWIHKGSVWG